MKRKSLRVYQAILSLTGSICSNYNLKMVRTLYQSTESSLISVLCPPWSKLYSESVRNCNCWTVFNIWENIPHWAAGERMSENLGRRLVEPYFGKCIMFTVICRHNEQRESGAPSLCTKRHLHSHCTTQRCWRMTRRQEDNKEETSDYYALQTHTM